MVNSEFLKVSLVSPFTQIVSSISRGRVGAVVVMRAEKIMGIITDGDVRRAMEKNTNIHGIVAQDIMSKSPMMITEGSLAVEAFRMMESKSITQLLVVNDQGDWLGVVHLHDLLREGIF